MRLTEAVKILDDAISGPRTPDLDAARNRLVEFFLRYREDDAGNMIDMKAEK
jgi:hypothetical protein